MHPLVMVRVIDGAYKHHFPRSGLIVHFTLKHEPSVVYDIDLLGFIVEAGMVAQGFKVPIAIFGGCAMVSGSWVRPTVAGIRGLLIDVCGCASAKKKRQDGKEAHKFFHKNSPWWAMKAETSISIAQVRRIMGVCNLGERLCSHRKKVLRMQE